MRIDRDGFDRLMREHSEQSRAGRKPGLQSTSLPGKAATPGRTSSAPPLDAMGIVLAEEQRFAEVIDQGLVLFEKLAQDCLKASP